jgi:hypothetical protein
MPKQIKCKICGNSYSSYGFSNHIKCNHNISIEEYVNEHGEFREQNENKNERDVRQIECGECGNEYSSVGMATHLKHSHNMTINEYVDQHSEFRKKYLRKQKYDDKKCRVCNKTLETERELTYHLKSEHELSKKEYAIQYIHDGERPTCKCGCGDKTSFIHNEPYFREYVSGHNAKGETNPMFGKQFDEETRKLMRKRAKERVENNETLPMHQNIGILKSTYGTWENYIDFLNDKKNIKCLSERKDLNSEMKFKCKICGNKWSSQSLGTDCNECKTEKSQEEKEVYEFIESIVDAEVQRNNRSVLNGGKELDIYIPSLDIGIEYNGLYWHSEWRGGKDKYYHLRKKKNANENGVHLIQIFSDEWKNRKEIVKSKLRYLLNASDASTVYGRECEVKKINVDDAKPFIEKTHIQGYSPSKYKLGLFHDSEMVAVMTFSKPRSGIGNSKSEYELNRYSTKKGIIPVGGMGKLFKHFVRNYDCESVKTYADRRWSKDENNAYEDIGMTLDSKSEPNYWYTLNYQNRKHRFNFSKSNLIENYNANPDKTEKEIMKEMGWDRVWDCGHLKYTFSS